MGNVLARSLLKEQPPSGIGKRYPLLGKIKRRCKKCEVGATKAVKDNLTKSKNNVKCVEKVSAVIIQLEFVVTALKKERNKKRM